MNTLKKPSIFLVLIFRMGSCSSEDENTTPAANEELVIGPRQAKYSTQDANPSALKPRELLSTIQFTDAVLSIQTIYTGTNCEFSILKTVIIE